MLGSLVGVAVGGSGVDFTRIQTGKGREVTKQIGRHADLAPTVLSLHYSSFIQQSVLGPVVKWSRVSQRGLLDQGHGFDSDQWRYLE